VSLVASEQQLRTALDLRTALRQIAMLLEHTARLQEEVIRLRQASARVRELAFHYELTGLPNRTLPQARFSRAIALAARRGRRGAWPVDPCAPSDGAHRARETAAQGRVSS